MKSIQTVTLLTFLFCSCGPARAVTISTVLVGDIGNPNDPADGDSTTSGVQNYGNVNYAYSIGKYEVTVGEYTAFLNAVAAIDSYALYDSDMAIDLNGAGISRTGASGSYSYSVIGSPNHPVTHVSWGDAARFVNWLHNGQPLGPQNNVTTEDGAYFLNGATSRSALNAVTRKVGAVWFLPTENEWYKAAYYQPAAVGGDADSYWMYPMKTNNVPYSDQPPGATPDNSRTGNFYWDDGLANGYNDGYAVTSSANYDNSQNYLTDVGAYASSPSFYGTFDQGGNVLEWNETVINGGFRGLRGGSWGGLLPELFNPALASSERNYSNPTVAAVFEPFGFRVAKASLDVGDFNTDGRVDAADYVLWRNNNGSQGSYNTWRANFGVGSGTGTAFANAIPEPQSWALLSLMAVSLVQTRRPRVRVGCAQVLLGCRQFVS